MSGHKWTEQESESPDVLRTIEDIAIKFVGALAALLERLARYPELFRTEFALLTAGERARSE